MFHGSRHPGLTAHVLSSIITAALQVATAVPAVAQEGAQIPEQRGPDAPGDEGRKWFVMDERPSLRVGDMLRLDLTSKLDLTVRAGRDVEADPQMEQRRIGVEGRLLDVIGFQVEREIRDDNQPWRDVFMEFRKWRTMRVRGGRFKIPFGQERLMSVSELDFARRSIASEALTPGRDTGVELNGRVFSRALTYRAGIFRHDGDVSRGGTDHPAGRTLAARVVSAPLSWVSRRALQRVEVGVSMTAGEVPEGLNGLRARTSNQFEAVSPAYVAGTRVRFAVDAAIANGPFSIKGEFLQARDERTRQGLRDEDLPDVVARGWYVSATSFVLGRLKSNGSAPRTPLFGGGIGAIQLAARVESLAFNSHAPGAEPLRTPRAAKILPNDIRALTVGVNWFPMRFIKVQGNVIREHVQDPDRRPIPARPWSTTGVFRVQFAL